MADVPKTVCMGCRAVDIELAVSLPLPQVGVCVECLTQQGWTLDSTADVLKRLGVGWLGGAQRGAAVTDAEATPTLVSSAGTAPEPPAWMRPRRTRFVVWEGTLEELAAYLTAMTEAREGGRRVYILRDEPVPAVGSPVGVPSIPDRRRWLLEVNEPVDEAPHGVAREERADLAQNMKQEG